MKSMNKRNFYILILIFLGLAGVSFWFFNFNNKKEKIEIGKKYKSEEKVSILKENLVDDNDASNIDYEEPEETKSKDNSSQNTGENSTEIKNKKLPDEVHMEVDFASQSPFASWDELHEEACEEASLIMVYYHLNEKSLTKEKMEKEIQGLAKYQNKEYGDYKDSDMGELKAIAEDYYGIENIKILENFNIEDLKFQLAEGHLIIIPAAGRELGNPNFTPPGPLYHNLVLIGYDNEREVFITNDPGTRKGENYEYDYDILYDAIHDFTGEKSGILEGKKRVLVFYNKNRKEG